MFLRETTCSARARMRGATFPGDASTPRLYPEGSGTGRAHHDPPSLTRRPERHPLRKKPREAERGQGARGVAHEGGPLGAQGPDEQQLPPLQLGQREAALLEEHDVRERLLLVGHHSLILRAMCSSSRTSFGVRSARWKSARHSRKWP